MFKESKNQGMKMFKEGIKSRNENVQGRYKVKE